MSSDSVISAPIASTTSFASRASFTPRSSTTSTMTSVKYGTVLSPGQSAVYPSSLYTATTRSSNSNGGLSGGTIAGIVVASVAGALLVAFLIALFVMYRRHKHRQYANKRDSRTNLLPTHANGTGGTASPASFASAPPGGGQPEMVQTSGAPSATYTGTTTYNNAGIAVPAAAAAAGAGAGAGAGTPKKAYRSGLRFGSFAPRTGATSNARGHRRSESTSSTTAFLTGAGDPNVRYSTENARPSLDSEFSQSPVSPARNRFSFQPPAATLENASIAEAEEAAEVPARRE